MKRPNETCFQIFATPRNRLKNRTAPFFRRGNLFSRLNRSTPGGNPRYPGGIFFLFHLPRGGNPVRMLPGRKGGGGGGETPIATVIRPMRACAADTDSKTATL